MTEPRPLAPPRLLALLLLVGCKASAPESMVVAPEPAASPACDQLAQRLCEELELDCAELRVVLREHEVPEDGCQDALASADAMERAPELPPEMMPLAYAKLLLEILRRSPKAEAEHLAQLAGVEEMELLAAGLDLTNLPLGERGQARAALGLPEGMKVLGLVGPLDPATHLETLSLAHRHLAGVALLVAGDGPAEGTLFAMANATRPSSPVIHVGPLTPATRVS